MAQALPADDREPELTDQPPLSAEEYLRRVRWEAKHMPEVVVATNVDPDVLENDGRSRLFARAEQSTSVPAVDDPVDDYLAGWFSAMQGSLDRACASRVRRVRDDTGAAPEETRSEGSAEHSDDESEGGELEGTPSEQGREALYRQCFDESAAVEPTVSVLAALEQVTVRTLLQYFEEWLQEEQESRGLTLVEALLIGTRAVWLFAVLMRVEPPFDAETDSVLRSMLRAMAIARSGYGEPSEGDHLNTVARPEKEVIVLDLFLQILRGVFRQE